MFLLQQPEVHLHPSTQTALGSLFRRIAGPKRQLVVETHSDHLLDRVRMDVRDGEAALKPADVSILYFERGDLDVRIHSLRLDGQGNVRGAPPSYRAFFPAIALAQTSGARLPYSDDGDLHRDFKNPALIDNPRGTVYSTLRSDEFTPARRRQLSRRDICTT